MIITRTTPVGSYFDSYMVEVELETFKGASETYITLGPFKRVQHRANLENLLQTLARIKTDGDNEAYHWILGFSQWFNKEITSFEELENYYSYSAANFHPEEEHEEIFAFSRGFVQDWPVEPQDDGYMQRFVSYKVYYYDYNGVKYNTEVKNL